MATLGTLAVNVVANTAGVEKGMARARSAVSSIKTPIKDAIGSLLNFKNAMAGIAAGVVVGGIVKLTAESETLKTRLTTLTGSAETAGKVFKDLKTFAAKTPFDVADIAAAANKLLAFGVSTSIVQERLKMLGDIASGSGSSLSEISSIFGKMKSSGVVALGDLNQLGDRGIPIMETLKTQLGLTGSELRKFVSSGKLGFQDVVTAMQTMTGEGGLMFKAMEKQSTTLAGQWSTLKGNVAELAAEIGTVFMPAAKAVVGALTQLTQMIKAIVPPIDSVQLKMGLWVTAFVATVAIIPKVIAAIRAIIVAVRAWTTAQAVALALSGPKGWATLAIGAVVATAAVAGVAVAYKGVTKDMDKAAKAAPKASKSISQPAKQATEDIAKAKKELDALMSAGASVTAANLTPAEKFRDEIGKLNKMAAVGAISWETYDRAVLKATGQLKDSIAAQMKLNQVTSGRRTVGALRRGSSAAFSASNASERAAQAAARAAQKQAELQRRTNDILKSIDNKTGVGAGGEDTTIIRNSIP